MQNETLETTKRFIKNNKSLYFGIKDDDEIGITTALKVEMIMLFISLNLEDIRKIDFESKELIEYIYKTHDYIINNNAIIVKNTILTINYFVSLINKIIDQQNDERSKKIIDISSFIKLTPKTEEPEEKPSLEELEEKTESGKLINVSELFNENQKEKKYLLERTLKVRKETLPYIEAVEINFKAQMNDIIYRIITNKKDEPLKRNELKVLFGIICIYPILVYNDEFLYEQLTFPSDTIYMPKAEYSNLMVRTLDKRIDECEDKIKILDIRKDYVMRYQKGNPEKLAKIEEERKKVYNVEMELGIKSSYLKQSKEVYNATLLNGILEAIRERHVDFSTDNYVTFFTIKDDKIDFYVEMNIDIFYSLINNGELLKIYENKNKLSMNL